MAEQIELDRVTLKFSCEPEGNAVEQRFESSTPSVRTPLCVGLNLYAKVLLRHGFFVDWVEEKLRTTWFWSPPSSRHCTLLLYVPVHLRPSLPMMSLSYQAHMPTFDRYGIRAGDCSLI
jgi:hypothetical protein